MKPHATPLRNKESGQEVVGWLLTWSVHLWEDDSICKMARLSLGVLLTLSRRAAMQCTLMRVLLDLWQVRKSSWPEPSQLSTYMANDFLTFFLVFRKLIRLYIYFWNTKSKMSMCLSEVHFHPQLMEDKSETPFWPQSHLQLEMRAPGGWNPHSSC